MAGSLVCQPMLAVEVPTTATTENMVGDRVSPATVGILVVKENSDEVAVFPDASRDLIIA